MGLFMVLATVMVAIALAFVIAPLRRRMHPAGASDGNARRLRALDDALAAGIIDADEFAAKRALIPSDGTPLPSASNVRSRATWTTLLLVAVLLPASALLLYRLVGTPQALDPSNLEAEAAAEHGDRGPEMEQAINALVARLKEHPDDIEGWALLGRAYQATGRPAEALDAFKRAHDQAPDNPDVAVEYAQALAFNEPDHRIQGQARTLLENAVKADAANQRALWLLGISDYQAGEYDAAIKRWNVLLPLLAADSDVAQTVKKQIADARARASGAPAPSERTSAAASTAKDNARPEPASEASASTQRDSANTAVAHLTVHVALDPKLKSRLDPNATLFIYARAEKGPPMPLAIQRLKASQLPATVTLDDSMGMLPTMKLSMFPQVIVGARISKSGNAMPESGDLQTLSPPIESHRTEPVALTINEVVP